MDDPVFQAVMRFAVIAETERRLRETRTELELMVSKLNSPQLAEYYRLTEAINQSMG
jgi:hypothetical protein